MRVPSPVSAVRNSAATVAEALLAAAIMTALVFFLAPVSQQADLLAGTGDVAAAKGGNGGGGRTAGATVAVVVLSGSDTVANHTERITFSVDTTATDRPFVELWCWQGTTGVFNNQIGIFDTYLWDPWLTLDSTYWTDGVEATCTARTYYFDKRGNQKNLSTIEVIVAP